jgi:hypothetical protein
MVQKKVLHITVTYPYTVISHKALMQHTFRYILSSLLKHLNPPLLSGPLYNTFLISLCKDGGKHLNHAQ